MEKENKGKEILKNYCSTYDKKLLTSLICLNFLKLTRKSTANRKLNQVPELEFSNEIIDLATEDMKKKIKILSHQINANRTITVYNLSFIRLAKKKLTKG
jgi:hypothetical protein